MKAILRFFIIYLLISNTVNSQTETRPETESMFEVIAFIKTKLIASESLSIDVKLIYYGCYGKSTVVSSILINKTRIKLISYTEAISGKMSYDTFSFTKKEFLDKLASHMAIVQDNGGVLEIAGASQEIRIECLGQKEVFYTKKGIPFMWFFGHGGE